MDQLSRQKYKKKQLKNSTLELENNFRSINISIFLEKELTKKGVFSKNTSYDWCDWLINYIPEPMKKP